MDKRKISYFQGSFHPGVPPMPIYKVAETAEEAVQKRTQQRYLSAKPQPTFSVLSLFWVLCAQLFLSLFKMEAHHNQKMSYTNNTFLKQTLKQIPFSSPHPETLHLSPVLNIYSDQGTQAGMLVSSREHSPCPEPFSSSRAMSFS